MQSRCATAIVLTCTFMHSGCTDEQAPMVSYQPDREREEMDAGNEVITRGPYEHVSAGGDFTCTIETGGAVVCWGANTWGQADPPEGTFSRLSAGFIHACGIREDGTLRCWGGEGHGRADAPDGLFKEISSGSQHSCAIRQDGTVVCWGDNRNGQLTPASDEALHDTDAGREDPSEQENEETNDNTYIQISAATTYTCGLKPDGTIRCWGSNADGRSTPPSGNFSQMSSGYNHSCALEDGSVHCWGGNYDGQLEVPSGSFTQVSSGDFYSCGIVTTGTVRCWGRNFRGQASAHAGSFIQVSAGSEHTCGLTDEGAVRCWGENRDGRCTPPPGP